jgi:hypothetical protein
VTQRTPHRSFAIAWLLAVAVVFAQGLGVAHRALHGSGGERTSWFANHLPGDADCKLLDQQSHGDALAVAVAALLPALAAFAVEAVPAIERAGRAPASLRARGPPRH